MEYKMARLADGIANINKRKMVAIAGAHEADPLEEEEEDAGEDASGTWGGDQPKGQGRQGPVVGGELGSKRGAAELAARALPGEELGEVASVVEAAG